MSIDTKRPSLSKNTEIRHTFPIFTRGIRCPTIRSWLVSATSSEHAVQRCNQNVHTPNTHNIHDRSLSWKKIIYKNVLWNNTHLIGNPHQRIKTLFLTHWLLIIRNIYNFYILFYILNYQKWLVYYYYDYLICGL